MAALLGVHGIRCDTGSSATAFASIQASG